MTDDKPVNLKKKKEKLIAVKVIHTLKNACLVEYLEDGSLQRKIVESAAVDGGKIKENDLDLGFDYGINWAKEFKFDLTSKALNDTFHNAGIWDANDVLMNLQVVQGVLVKLTGLELSKILNIANKQKKEVKHDDKSI